MGVCDLIPGISGGTIAFITGIYERLIENIKLSISFCVELIKLPFTRSSKNLTIAYKKIDLYFLFALFLGIVSALLLVSKVIVFLLEQYFIYTLAFFIGLIVASSKVIFESIPTHSLSKISLGYLGILLGASLLFIVPYEVSEPSLWYILLSGFLAVFALFLPGISGSFILLLLGTYEFMLSTLSAVSTYSKEIITFVFGAMIGTIVISHLISYLFKKGKSSTLYFLLGIVLGSLAVPINMIVTSVSSINLETTLLLFIFFLLGSLLVLIIDHVRR